MKKLQEIDGLKLDVWETSQQDLNEYPLHPIRVQEWNYQNRPNVVGILRGAGGGRSLILNGHVDVVSPEPISEWKHEPWKATIEEGKLYGRGAMDMKAGLAAMIYAVLSLDKLELRLMGDVILESVVEEELGGGGTIAAVLRGYTADAAVIPEPTSADAICIGTGGSRFFTIRISGKPEWPHLAHLGVNAIGLAQKIYNALLELNEDRARKLQGKFPAFETMRSGAMRDHGRATNLTLGIMKAGDWPATVAGWAELQGRIGFPPTEKGEEVAMQIEKVVDDVASQDSWMRDHPPKITWWGARREGYEIPSEHELVQVMKRNIIETIGSCDLFAIASAGDGSYLAPRIGQYGGIPTVWYGPGGSGAHSVDEHVNLEEVVSTTKALALSMMDWCGRSTS